MPMQKRRLPKKRVIVTVRLDMEEGQRDRLLLLADGEALSVEELIKALISRAWRRRTEHERYLRRKDAD